MTSVLAPQFRMNISAAAADSLLPSPRHAIDEFTRGGWYPGTIAPRMTSLSWLSDAAALCASESLNK